MQKARKDVISALEYKGFNITERSHHFFVYRTFSGKLTDVHTMISHGSSYKSLGDELLSKMAKQCRLAKKDFLDLINCPLSREQYEEKLREKGII